MASTAALLAVGALMFAVSASGHDRNGRSGGEESFRLALTPSLRTGLAIHGVAPDGRNWALAEGRAELSSDRRRSTQLAAFEERLEVKGLVRRRTGSPGPARNIKASIFCGTTRAFLSRSALLSGDGDAELEASVLLRRCLAPVVLVNPNGDTMRYPSRLPFGKERCAGPL
jgi:hypothetical protein